MTVGIVGLGLVGGSLALDLVARDVRVVGHDTFAGHRDLAVAAGVEVVDGVAAVAGAADLVVVAVPPAAVADVVRAVAAEAPDTTVTDVASVCSAGSLGLDPAPAHWVGGHPMAGTERTGFGAARRGMLAGATWLVTPDVTVAPDDLATVLDLVLAVDAVPVVLAPEEHDRIVAAVSHVTHLLSFGLHGVAGGLGREVVDLVAGPSFRDATRVAASDPAFWADLVGRNREAVRELVDDVRAWLAAAVDEDTDALAERLAAARRRPVATHPDTSVVRLDGDPATTAELQLLGRAGYAVTEVVREPGGVRCALARR